MAGQLDYSMEMSVALEGAPEHAHNHDRLSFTNPLGAQTTTLTVGATLVANSSYTYSATNADGVVATVTVSYVAAPASVTVVASNIAAAINASSQFVGIASATSAVGVVTVAYRRPTVYTNATAVVGAGVTLVAANTTQAGGSYLRVGTFAKRGAGDFTLTPVVTGTTISQIVGVAVRTGQIINGESYGLSYDAYRPGDVVAIGRSERIRLRVYAPVTPTSVPFIWIDHTDTSVPVGGLVNAANGGKAIDASSICSFLTTATSGSLSLVEVFCWGK